MKQKKFRARTKRYSAESPVVVVKQHEIGMPVEAVVRKLGIDEVSFSRCKEKYIG